MFSCFHVTTLHRIYMETSCFCVFMLLHDPKAFVHVFSPVSAHFLKWDMQTCTKLVLQVLWYLWQQGNVIPRYNVDAIIPSCPAFVVSMLSAIKIKRLEYQATLPSSAQAVPTSSWARGSVQMVVSRIRPSLNLLWTPMGLRSSSSSRVRQSELVASETLYNVVLCITLCYSLPYTLIFLRISRVGKPLFLVRYVCFNPIHPIGNSLKKRISMYIVLMPSIKPSI